MLNLNLIRKNRKKVLGLNERYLEFIRPSNKRRAIKIADDKVLTKRILSKNNIPVPQKIKVIKSSRELEEFDFNTLPNEFVIKPVHGTRGGGVEIFYNRDKNGKWIRGDGSKLSADDIKTLAQDLLDGKYSLHNEPDVVLIEERIKPIKTFRYYTYKGTPDVRIIVYNNIPIMSYLRLPTLQSQGKANLDLGAIGAGIDMAVGKTTTAIKGKAGYIETVPETHMPLSGLRIPYWDKILRYAIETSKATGLGFAGIDFLIDKDKGPMVIELNARPGLSIQLSNSDGLRWRLKKASGIKVKSVDQGIRLAKDLFGGEIEEGIEAISGKNVIGIYENVSVFGPNGKSYEGKAKIDTGADSSSIDKDIVRSLGYGDIIDTFDKLEIPENLEREKGLELMRKYKEELTPKFENLIDVNLIHSSHGTSLRPYIKIELQIDNTRFETNATVYDRANLQYPIIVGRKSLGKFLVDPSKIIK